MAAKILPEQSILLQLLRYEPETGKLFWRERGPEWFMDGYHSAEVCARRWNTKNAGKEAFTAVTVGYRIGGLFDVLYLAHRIIWKMVHGTDADQVDHIDGNRSNNRIENLRDVSETTNKRNAKRPSHNTSGVVGISFDQSRKQWEAYITLADRKHTLGRYDEFDDAVAARKAAEIEYGFHANHGRAA